MLMDATKFPHPNTTTHIFHWEIYLDSGRTIKFDAERGDAALIFMRDVQRYLDVGRIDRNALLNGDSCVYGFGGQGGMDASVFMTIDVSKVNAVLCTRLT
ncbi:MAG: hypothetical protein L3J37_00810 [Rhodobacteraceae bacterium]|nr:hypothetical protein [Paracoccaceae bacterium]